MTVEKLVTPRIEMMGCQIDNLTMEETLQTVEGFIKSASRTSMWWSTSISWSRPVVTRSCAASSMSVP